MLICMQYNQEYTLSPELGFFFKMDGKKAALGALALFDPLNGKLVSIAIFPTSLYLEIMKERIHFVHLSQCYAIQ